MNKITFSALAASMIAGSALGATSIKSVEDLATNIVTNRAPGDLESLSLGTLFGGESVLGDTANSLDNLSGDVLPEPGFPWTGGDDVYSLQWGGGDITIDLYFAMNPGSTTNDGDLDIWLVANENLNNTNVDFSLSTSDNEKMVQFGLAPGKYWIIIDGYQDAHNSYKLAVSPTPGAAAVFGLAGLAAAGRRRR